MAPTTDNNARDERSVLRPNPAIFLRDFTLYMTTNYAIIRKRCLNYNACITYICPASFIKDTRFRLKLQKMSGICGLNTDSSCFGENIRHIIHLYYWYTKCVKKKFNRLEGDMAPCGPLDPPLRSLPLFMAVEPLHDLHLHSQGVHSIYTSIFEILDPKT